MKTKIFFSVLLLLGSDGGLLPAEEYQDIDFGRELIDRTSFPTIAEFETLAEQRDISLALMFRLVKSSANVVNPCWSSDGQRLSIQSNDPDRNICKIFIFDHLGMETPTAISTASKPYDYMFRWGVGNPSSFIYGSLEGGKVRLWGNFGTVPPADSTSVVISKPQDLGLSGDLYANPALYVRTDRIARIAFDRKGDILRAASRIAGKNSRVRKVMPGQSPRWGRDGRLLLAIERDTAGEITGRLAIADIGTNKINFYGGRSAHARSPNWSPDQQYVSCYTTATRVSDTYAIQLARVQEGQSPPAIDKDIVVNFDFTTLGPCWSPNSRQLWFFSNQYREEAYYPLIMQDIDSNSISVIDYPQVCTSPSDVTINPVTAAPELVFVGHRDLAQDVFVMMLNHF